MARACPVCREGTLSAKELEANLVASECQKCKGTWIKAFQYQQWLDIHGKNLPEKSPDAGVNLASAEAHGAKFCPECNYFMLKYKVGHQVGFSIDRCGQCGGVWFDANEWEIMKSRNLHDDVHLVFSQPWQSAVRAEEHKSALDEMLTNQLGAADFQEAQRIKAWLQKHPKAPEIIAYLSNSDAALVTK